MSAIKPALTAEEWRTGMFSSRGIQVEFPLYIDGVYQPENAPKLVALLMYEQPFGFTREDATQHRESAQACFTSGQTIGPGSMHDWHESMADRIEALLPPEEK